jgi:hypothetical protein
MLIDLCSWGYDNVCFRVVIFGLDVGITARGVDGK